MCGQAQYSKVGENLLSWEKEKMNILVLEIDRLYALNEIIDESPLLFM